MAIMKRSKAKPHEYPSEFYVENRHRGDGGGR